MNSKTSIFVSYAALVLVGFGGTALFAFADKINDPFALITFLGFYGFLSITCVFYALGKQTVDMDSFGDDIRKIKELIHSRSDEIHRRIDGDISSLSRRVEEEAESIWDVVNHVESDVSDLKSCPPCTPCKK